ncbi:TPA_asm: protein jag [Listeria monocytogenes]|uniref:RNA-binding protein KhpB n=1 Tax=Listeria monocytogenes TaxID=1639 RepID=A0A2Z5C4A4_LISMN|nr:RNA-binding cell elongation regulator Jag/EloR [Listeria monocytogenes]EAE3711229.1 protein jag [Listeria monocytogenes serotype 1/2b]EAF3076021.1 protein jag [Listeria monocytogenes serotype 1/2a]EAG6253868.1 protein jag [Listeria monocytogenes CFSAN003806]EAG6262787.1 protein jag [Listeria monocytogenes CFSAN003725]EAG6332769.1 protein jag [Listeria monocytogenes CFSAN002346]EAG6374559.1 protein jag [Listeria monocytogenes CFSAN002356]EGC3054333.1 protein jag [Listeria monocytogenes CFS
MRDITAQGSNVEEAIQNALATLETTRDKVEVEVLDEGKKGIFGIGSRLAMVKVIEKEDGIQVAIDYLLDVATKMGAVITIDVEEVGKDVKLQIKGDNLGMLIGKHGQTLNALQYLTQLIANKTTSQYKNIIVNVGDYRERRHETLVILANKMADKALKTKRAVHLEPMPSFERKIIHAILSENEQIETHSEGRDPYRYIVIKPVRK